MSLQLIGAGFGRTGTLSLKLALEQIGFGPCYHMFEVIGRPEHVAAWSAAADGSPVDWRALFRDFRATVDWPACRYWRELSEVYPDAHVLLSVRSAESWYESAHATIYQAMTGPEPPPGPMREQRTMARKLVLEGTFDGRFEDREYAMDVYRRHNERVRAECKADRLLVYELGSGWGPLCDFLGVATPDTPYPRTNSSDEFKQHLASASS